MHTDTQTRTHNNIMLTPYLHMFCNIADDDILHWNAMIMGPPNTAYEGGVFSVDLKFDPDYPFKTPRVMFLTKVYHPNISLANEIIPNSRLSFLYDDWGPTLNIRFILNALKQLLEEPPLLDQQLNLEAATLYKDNKDKFVAEAKKWTLEHAT